MGMHGFRKLVTICGLCLSVLVAGCGGAGDGGSTPAASTLNGVAAVGFPIVNGVININCAAGSALTTTTNSTGSWQVTLSGQTLPCAVQVTGGTINGAANSTSYHSIATSTGTVNVTPLTDLMVANLAGAATPDIWFAGLTPSTLGTINQTSVDAALAKLRAALSGLTPLSTIDPITTAFTPTAGNASDDMLAALSAAMASANVTYTNLLNNASVSTFAAPAGFGTALTAAYAGTTSGGGSAGGTAPVLSTGSGYSIVYSAGAGVGIDVRPNVSATFNATSGAMEGYSFTKNGATTTDEAPTIGTMSTSELAGDGLITIGRWNNGTSGGKFYSLPTFTLADNDGFHYAVGTGTATLPTTGVVSYAVSKATTTTWYPMTASFTPLTGSIAVDFANLKIGLQLSLSVNGTAYTIDTTGGLAAPSSGGFYSGNLFHTFYNYDAKAISTDCPSGGCTVSIRGFVAGATAQELGVVIQISDSRGTSYSSTAAIFTKQ